MFDYKTGEVIWADLEANGLVEGPKPGARAVFARLPLASVRHTGFRAVLGIELLTRCFQPGGEGLRGQ